MSAFRGLVLLGAAAAAVSTLGMRAAEQVAPQDPSAQYQLATQLRVGAIPGSPARMNRLPRAATKVSSFARARGSTVGASHRRIRDGVARGGPAQSARSC